VGNDVPRTPGANDGLRNPERSVQDPLPDAPWPYLALPFPDDAGIRLLGQQERRLPLQVDYPRRIIRNFEVDLKGSAFEVQVFPSDDEIDNHDLTFRARYRLDSPKLLSGEQFLETRAAVLLPRNYDVARRIHLAMESARGPAFGLTR
jgi:hypothetical protein